MSLGVRVSTVSRDQAAAGVCGGQLRWCDKRRQHPTSQKKKKKSTECVCVVRDVLGFVVPVKGSACGHTSGKALDSQLSEVGDGREIGSHDGQ